MHPNQYELSVRANLDISLIRVYGSRIFFFDHMDYNVVVVNKNVTK